jgi:hypothetical protein
LRQELVQLLQHERKPGQHLATLQNARIPIVDIPLMRTTLDNAIGLMNV